MRQVLACGEKNWDFSRCGDIENCLSPNLHAAFLHSVITFCGTAFFTSCLDLLLSYFPHSFHLDGRFLTKEPNIHKGDWVICPITKNKNKINDAGKTGDFDAEG